eukprot:TRINITY_DN5448_c0_g1_i3.p2 TRINITY_DN5448_c0_g1~~TRINITY_DN5448_c0_g1_i3.p2  ORF type:complete len:132 (-),score=53.98 TRINITY_DN5448_c0_g1_i3:1093-1488(-)
MSSSEEENTKKRARSENDDNADGSGDDNSESGDTPKKKQQKSSGKVAKKVAAPPAKKQKKTDDEAKEWPLGPKRKVTISDFKGKTLINIREYWTDASGEEKPGKKGISLTVDQWKNLAAAVEEINEAIENS